MASRTCAATPGAGNPETRPGIRNKSSGRRRTPNQHEYEGENDANDGKRPSNVDGGAGDPAEAQHGGDDGDNKECDGPGKHGGTPFVLLQGNTLRSQRAPVCRTDAQAPVG